jgi:hypothetical protein
MHGPTLSFLSIELGNLFWREKGRKAELLANISVKLALQGTKNANCAATPATPLM